jgi:hypothetical protein
MRTHTGIAVWGHIEWKTKISFFVRKKKSTPEPPGAAAEVEFKETGAGALDVVAGLEAFEEPHTSAAAAETKHTSNPAPASASYDL